MKKSKIYEIAVLWHPTEDQFDEQKLRSKFVVEIQTILAKDESEATMKAFMAIPMENKGDLEQLEVIVRLF